MKINQDVTAKLPKIENALAYTWIAKMISLIEKFYLFYARQKLQGSKVKITKTFFRSKNELFFSTFEAFHKASQTRFRHFVLILKHILGLLEWVLTLIAGHVVDMAVAANVSVIVFGINILSICRSKQSKQQRDLNSWQPNP